MRRRRMGCDELHNADEGKPTAKSSIGATDDSHSPQSIHIPQEKKLSFHKSERLVSRKLIEALFGGWRSHSAVVFPIRAVYMLVEGDKAGVEVLVSVSKRHFKRAVKRNRVKRQIREAYRKNKQQIAEKAALSGKTLCIAFVWLADRLYDTAEVENSVRTLMQRVAEKI